VGLADIYRLSITGLTSARPLVAAPAVDADQARALREAIVASDAKQAAAAASSGLRAAIERQIASARPGHGATSTSAAAIAAELVTGKTDTPALGLAKAVARQCVRQLGAVKATPTIEHVRAMAAGIDPGAQRGGAWRMPASARVLGAAPKR
jgi:hypothetical protein